jgi:HEAT repeat protein
MTMFGEPGRRVVEVDATSEHFAKRRPMTAASEPQAALLPEHRPLVDWLEALSHDSPFERGQDPSIWNQAAPRLALAPILISLLKDPDRDVRVRVLAALGTLGGQAHRVMPVLRAALKETALKDDDESVRSHAAHALLQVGPEPDSELAGLTDSLQNELEVLRFHAAAALGDLGPDARPALSPLIHAALWDEDPAVRVEAAVALWKIDRNKRPLVIPALIKALADDNELICWIAADCLGQIGPEAREAVPALRETLGRSFKIGLIRKGVALALQRIDGQTTPEAALPTP